MSMSGLRRGPKLLLLPSVYPGYSVPLVTGEPRVRFPACSALLCTIFGILLSQPIDTHIILPDIKPVFIGPSSTSGSSVSSLFNFGTWLLVVISVCLEATMFVLIWTIALLASATLYLLKAYSRFSDRDVKNRTPIPFLGNLGAIALGTRNQAYVTQETYKIFANQRFFGHYEFINPQLIIKDLDLIKNITIKDFDYFADHRAFINEERDPLFARNLFSMAGLDWRDMRPTLSPAFTSSKIKLMVPFMVDVGKNMMACLKKKINNSEVGYIEEDAKDLATRYANDVIASCAFGVNVDSHNERDNQFYLVGKETANFGFFKIVKLFLYMSFPKIMSKANVSIFSEKTKSFFIKIVSDMMKDREEKNIVRPDMIHLLMEAKKGILTHDNVNSEDAGFATVEESDIGMKKHSRVWTDIELTAQAVIFFLGGFDTISTAISFLLMELAINHDVQDKLLEEIQKTDQKHGGKFDYKVIQEMPYLDMVVSEIMRLWPPGPNLDRLCVKDYNMGKANPEAKTDYIVHKGEGIGIPVYAIHRDPQYFPNPDTFDPERFSEQNRRNIKPFSYMPFGLGPRNCIGSRFALCEIKAMVYQLLKEVEVSPSSKTCIPIEYSPDFLNPKPKGSWLKFTIRK